ncbi:MAG TPA: alpha/beta hydrolase [Gammaproteobacteria bacterium]|nr:alpha/beta hydrolase [Gammaproteobacteria bacterium]
MSDKPVLILVHGMGKHPPGAFAKEFTAAIHETLHQVDGYESTDINTLVDIQEFNYDGFFDEIRKKMKNQAKPVAERLGAINQLAGLSWGPGLVLKLSSFEANYGKDKFFYTHCLDVIFYATLLGAKVRVDAARKIAQIVRDNAPEKKIHVLAHSLGTAVAHDTLSQLYRGDFVANDDIPDLDLVTHRLKSVWMVANVSRLVNSVTDISDPYKSTVRPGPDGCTDYLRNVHHELDPFTLIKSFHPKNDGSWVPRDHFDFAYSDIETSAVTDINTHDFSEYIKNPKVALPLLRTVCRIVPSRANSDDIYEKAAGRSIAGAYQALKDAYSNIQLTDTDSLQAFLEAAKAVNEFRDRFQGELSSLGH